MISPVNLFSYWIFAWFLLWICFSSKKNELWWSPWLILLFALVENVASWIWLVQQHVGVSTLSKYGFMILLIKVLPLWLVWPPKLQDFPWKQNALLILCVLAVYVAVLPPHESPLSIYRRTMTSIVQGTNETPLFYVMDKISSRIKNNV